MMWALALCSDDRMGSGSLIPQKLLPRGCVVDFTCMLCPAGEGPWLSNYCVMPPRLLSISVIISSHIELLTEVYVLVAKPSLGRRTQKWNLLLGRACLARTEERDSVENLLADI